MAAASGENRSPGRRASFRGIAVVGMTGFKLQKQNTPD
jgi:hypothetical protein